MLDAHSSQKQKGWIGEQQRLHLYGEVPHIGLVDFIRNINKGGASECLFCNPPPEEGTDEAINLLAGDSKPSAIP